ncbi:Formin-like protein [Abeliophyllum distichum]|uniref:Formin-like protein n=1 Tax=Abeliophyllum distichum TaxID=126358 RepID=A0ABD1PU23_9LAMI
MGKRGIVCFMAFIVLLSNLAAAGGESDGEGQEPLLAYLMDSGGINQEMAEFLWLNCRLEFMHAKEALENLESYASEVRSSDSKKLSNGRLSSKADIHKTANCFHPRVKKILLDYLRERNLMLPVSGEEKGLKSWYTRYLGFLFARPDSSSRRELIQRIGEAPARAPTVSPPSRATSIPTASNAPFPASPTWFPFFLPDLNDSSLQIKSSKNSSRSKNSASKKRSSKQESGKITVIATVAIAAVSLVAALLCFCCCRCCRSGTGRGRNDEKPLLCLSLSDHSIASSRKSYDLETLMNEDRQGNLLFNGSLNQSKTIGKFYADSHSVSDSEIKIPVGNTAGSGISSGKDSMQMPPGMLGTAGCPPLKPPPGRIIPPKPPLGNTAPPPSPPVPPPAPPIKPASNGSHPLPPPPILSGMKSGPRPPPPRPPPVGLKPPRRSPLGPNQESSSTSIVGGEGAASKTKLKPFFWDKVSANPDNAMVWDQIKSGSFQFNEEMIETLFGYAPDNLSILLKALNVTTEEVSDALQEGNELPSELIQTLLKMAPTSEEELKLRLYSGELSRLGPADRFLKALVEIPFAFRRLETLLLMCTLQEETSTMKESFKVLEVACTELQKSRLFLKLLEAVLKTGNRMNDGTFRGGAQAFKLDTLLKLSDVKGIDGKTTLLLFVVQEIIRSEESDEHFRSIGLQVVSGLGNQLENVKKAAVLDADGLTGTVSKLGHAFIKARDFLNSEMKDVDEENGFHQTLKSFVQNAEADVMFLLEEENRIMALVKSTADYFHGTAGKDEGLRLFVIVRDFLIILDKVCKEVKNAPRKPIGTSRKEESADTPTHPRKTIPADARQRLSSAISDKRMDSSSSDDD